ncbi:hypothetical protein H4219_004481 [Mycoemilia scoparia]|uniref:Uncharacterized protein n=1 Tax=Mycoemilia scoparia TaxID=417184 RepID=A0A9W7ZRI9_9FUNG|nr:hypothetical protein H4219_004481 [Mycoemilia scoparia]
MNTIFENHRLNQQQQQVPHTLGHIHHRFDSSLEPISQHLPNAYDEEAYAKALHDIKKLKDRNDYLVDAKGSSAVMQSLRDLETKVNSLYNIAKELKALGSGVIDNRYAKDVNTWFASIQDIIGNLLDIISGADDSKPKDSNTGGGGGGVVVYSRDSGF